MSIPMFEGWSLEMATASYQAGQWGEHRIIPMGTVAIHPGAMGVQFGQSVFEGCRAFSESMNGSGSGHETGKQAFTFRLPDHHQRLVASCARVCIPPPPRELFLSAINALVRRAGAWRQPFTSDTLYIRPIVFGTDNGLVPNPSLNFAFVVLTAPLRPFQGEGVSLWIEREYSRSARGGLGASKTAANYAHQLLPTTRAHAAGADSVLWLDACRHDSVEEASTMNLFFRINGRVATPKLEDSILPGITRHSVLSILREQLSVPVEERAISVQELQGNNGTFEEAFCVSTALGVQPVLRLMDQDRVLLPSRDSGLAAAVRKALAAMQRGTNPSPWISAVPFAPMEGMP